MRKIVLVAAALGLVAVLAHAVGLSGLIVNEPALAYSKRFTWNLSNAAVNTVAAQADYSSATLTSKSFSSGQVSTGSFTVDDNTLVSSAAPSTSITVASVDGALGDSIVIPAVDKPGAYVLTAGRDWNYKASTALTAASIKLALAKVPWLSLSRVNSVIFATAPVGGRYVGIPVTTNNTNTITISSPTLIGGRSPTSISVNGYSFLAGRDFAIGATASDTAGNIRTAINAKSGLSSQVLAAGSSANVTLVSKKVGTIYNFSLTTSNSSAISVLHPTMIGGLNAGSTIGSALISISAHSFSLALPVLYSGSGTYPINPLVNQTTYYAIPVDANTIKLADSSAHAQAGTALTITSSQTLTSAQTYTLAPLAFTAAAATGFKWQVSNDGSTWSDVNVATVSWISGGGAGSTSWNLTGLNYKYLGLNVVGPATGGLTLQVNAQGSYQY